MKLTNAVAVATVTLFFVACSAENEIPPTPLGNPETHERIRTLTDCDELLQEFNRAMAVFDASSPGSERRTVALAYAETATERMKAVPDCK